MTNSCTTCTEVERRGYCAPARCYCGHSTCHAFDSFINLNAVPLADAPTTKPRGRSSWDDREKGSSWIDQM